MQDLEIFAIFWLCCRRGIRVSQTRLVWKTKFGNNFQTKRDSAFFLQIYISLGKIFPVVTLSL